MWTWLRRLFWLSLACGAGYAAYTAWQRKNEPVPDGPPEWPPLSETSPTPEGGWSTDTHTAADRRWVEPVDGACPDGYPVKANVKSGIYHVPGGRFYDRTAPERCYADEAGAEADGYRRSKA